MITIIRLPWRERLLPENRTPGEALERGRPTPNLPTKGLPTKIP